MPVGTEKTPDEMIEEGVGLIARGMYRLSQGDKQEACDAGLAAVSTIRELAFGFIRKQQQPSQQ